MKVCMVGLETLPDLPEDFETRYPSAWVDTPWWELVDPHKVSQFYRGWIDEYVYAAKAGLDGICVTEHHSNTYGFLPNPNLIAAILARLTDGMEVALVVIGAPLTNTIPPLRLAEEYAMLDGLSGGRFVAGLPLGLPMDANWLYGISPMEMRERYREAHDLMVKAWRAKEVFAWNGKYFQFAKVNPWPRPVQQPHPPIWVPGTGSPATWEFAVDHEYCYCFLTLLGAHLGSTLAKGYWDVVAQKGKDPNPYRCGLMQLVAVAETDARAEQDYGQHIAYLYQKCLHVPSYYRFIPGYVDYPGLVRAFTAPAENFEAFKEMSYRDFVEQGFVIAGGPATVRDRLIEAMKEWRAGRLLAFLRIGSMPHQLVLKNIELFSREVLPYLRPLWDDEGWEDRWWPEALRNRRKP